MKNGRKENEDKIEKYIMDYLSDCDEILTKYYYSIPSKSFTTKRTYIMCINSFLNSCDKKYDKVTENDVNKYLYGLDSSRSHINTSLYAIKSFYEFLRKKEKVITENPCDDVELPRYREENSPVVLTTDEISEIIKNIDEMNSPDYPYKRRDKAIIRLMLHSGLRVSAVCNINMEDIDLDKCTIHVIEKENFSRDIYIDDITRNIIEDWIYDRSEHFYDTDTNSLFLSSRNLRISPATINLMIKKYTENIDKNITAHKLRSTFATNVYRQTGDILLTSKLLGHNSIETTKRYADASDEQKINAINALKNTL